MGGYDQVLASYYDLFSKGIEGDVAFYAEEALRAGSPVLELGCGTGRILIPLAEAGVQVVGLDNSPEMLDLARARVAALGRQVRVRIELVQGDMRGFALNQRFKLIVIPYRAFLHMLTVKDQRQALECVREHLANDGHLVLNVFDPSLETIASFLGPLKGVLREATQFVNPATGRKVLVWESRDYDPLWQTVKQWWIFEELDGQDRLVSKVYTSVDLRWITRFEMEHLLELCGYRVDALYGDFGRGMFQYGGEQIWVASRR